MVITYILYVVLFKDIVNLTLVCCFAVYRKKVNINNYLGRILYWSILFMSNIWYCKCLQLSDDIKLSTGPKPTSC